MSDDINIKGLANRGLPASTPGDAVQQPVRVSRYGEHMSQLLAGGLINPLADEGSYFVATNPTPGTAILGNATPTALSDTVSLLTLYNGGAVSGTARRIYLDFIMLRVVAVGTSSTNFNLTGHVDAAGTSRYGSGGSGITPVNPNMDNSNAAQGVLKFGALTTTAASSAQRLVHHEQARSVIPVAGDRYLLLFGRSAPVTPGMATEGTAQLFLPIHCPPVILGPTQTYVLHEWAASQAAARSYEFVMGWYER